MFFLVEFKILILNRYRPTQGDLVVFEAVKKAPSGDLENASRWYKHIASFNDAERQK
jgi:elongation factor 1-beta